MKKLKPSIAKVMFNVRGFVNQEVEGGAEQETEPCLELKVEMPEAVVIASTNKDSLVESQELSEFLLFDADIPNQDIEYLGSDKVIQLTRLFCQQIDNEYSNFSSLSAIDQHAKLHKLKGAAIGLGLVRLYQLCHTLEINTEDNKLTSSQLLMIDELAQLSKRSLNQYAQSLKNI